MSCRICGSDDLEELIDLGRQPFANKYPERSKDFADEFFGLLVVNFCNSCLSAQIIDVHSRDEMFLDYYYLSSVNPGLVDHFTELANELSESRFVLDIGSNDGVLLRPLKSNRVPCLGVDPSKNVGALANAEGLQTEIGFFDEAMANKIYKQVGRPEHIVASSVVTHLENPHSFFDLCASILAVDGQLIIEIEYLPAILSNIQFERFYFDRPHYYSLHGVKKLAEKSGLNLQDAVELKQHGGSVRITLGFQNKISEAAQALLNYEIRNLRRLSGTFASNAKAEMSKLLEFISDISKRGENIVGFGCPARFATITNFGDIGPSLIPHVIDDSPLKVGKFSPGTHVPIIEYDWNTLKSADCILVFAYEYFDTIKLRLPKTTIGAYRPLPLMKLEP